MQAQESSRFDRIKSFLEEISDRTNVTRAGDLSLIFGMVNCNETSLSMQRVLNNEVSWLSLAMLPTSLFRNL